jgi:Holliday junction resolvase-like predicted endonuclease
MTPNDDEITNLVNAAGFLFQLRVEHEIKTRLKVSGSNWDIAAREYRWVNRHTGDEGYIDLILRKGIVVLVIECKRVTNGVWAFLSEDGVSSTQRARLLWTHQSSGSKPTTDWADFTVDPSSPESLFCVVRGHGEKDKPMMERIASNLMNAVEALAEQELQLSQVADLPKQCIFVPLIITNAELVVPRYNVASISIADGQIETAHSEKVPLVRFRKSLFSAIPQRSPKPTIEESNRESERTVLIMSSTELVNVLNKFDLPYTGSWPWSRL